MKNFTSLFLMIFAFTTLNAQTIEIDFVGTGDTTIVDSVIVENLNQSATLTLQGNDVLQLHVEAIENGIFHNSADNSLLQVYPNPMTEQANLEFELRENGNVLVKVLDMSGRSVIQCKEYLAQGRHRYRVSGLHQGIYLIQIQAGSKSSTAKLVSRNGLAGIPELSYVTAGRSIPDLPQEMDKSVSFKAAVEMAYTEGDRLKFTGFAGPYSRIVTEIPSGNSTLSFDFMDCTDADSNHYTVVSIGEQTFMAENLETTHYSDGTPIPLVREVEAWMNILGPAYCWYDNDSLQYKDIYGALYNWWAIDTASNGAKNVCPSGWHIPSDAEWATLSTYLGGDNIAGGKLKETGTAHWNSPNIGATNETGFTIRGTGWRYGIGEFHDMGVYNCLWTGTPYNETQAYYRELDSNQRYLLRYNWYKKCGFSVRCVKD